MKKFARMTLTFILAAGLCFATAVNAADTTTWDVDFGSWPNVPAPTTDEGGNPLTTGQRRTIFNEATGWTLTTLGAGAELTVVNAADENIDWADKGKILKLTGDGGGDSKLDIIVPFSGYNYDNDKLYIEFDLYSTKDENDERPGSQVLFGSSSNNGAWQTASSTGVQTIWWYYAKSVSEGKPAGTGHSAIMQNIPSDCWQRIQFIVDGCNYSPVSLGGQSFVNQYTLQPVRTDLQTGAVTKGSTYIFASEISKVTGNLLLQSNTSKGLTYIDNLKVYTRNKFGISTASVSDGEQNVRVEKRSFDITMTQSADIGSLENIAVKIDNEVIDASEYSVTLKGGNTVNVAFADPLEYLKDYTIDLSGVKDIYGQNVELGDGVISFTTADYPDIYITDVETYKGFGAGFAKSPVIADSNLYTALATVKNNADAQGQVTVLYTVFKQNGQLAKCIYSQKHLAAGKEEILGTGLSFSEEFQDGFIKVLSWENVSGMKPWQGFISIPITNGQ